MDGTNRNDKAMKWFALAGACLVYAGAVVYGDIMFLTVMQSAFPSGILGALAMVGAVMTAASALLLPLALHFWFAPGKQTVWGYVFWVIDIALLALNAMLAYATATSSGMFATWREFSPATPLFAVLGWGLAFMFDPSQHARHAQAELEADLIDIHAKQLKTAAKSEEVYKLIEEGAMRSAQELAGLLTSIRPSNDVIAGKAADVTPAKPERKLPSFTWLQRPTETKNGHKENPTKQ